MLIMMAAGTLILSSIVSVMLVAAFYWRRDFNASLTGLEFDLTKTKELVGLLQRANDELDMESVKRRLVAIEMRGQYK